MQNRKVKYTVLGLIVTALAIGTYYSGISFQTDSAQTNILSAYCGNGITEENEECDDGNTIEDDGCMNTCTKNFCGDNYINEDKEECDDGNASDSDECTRMCTKNFCGDGFKNEGVEQCDDGNVVAGDGCSIDCKLE